MAQASKVFRIFVSSTFSDLKAERNALHQHVFPHLRELCAQHGCRFQAIDLRWGVSEEAALDQQTMRICLDEIARCRRVTPRPNFLVLLGDRYGWRPLPHAIPASEFELIKPHVSNPDDRDLLHAWYRWDNNVVPPVFALQSRTGTFTDLARWEGIERRLQGILRGAIAGAALPAGAPLKYVASATEQEVRDGALPVPDVADHVFGFFRTIRTAHGRRLIDDLPAEPAVADFVDLTERDGLDAEPHGRLEALKGHLRRALPHNIAELAATWVGDGITLDHLGTLPEDLDACLRLLEDPQPPTTLCGEVWRRLARVIREEIAGIAAVDALDKEIADHEAFGAERVRFFTGRVSALQTIADYLRRDDPHPLVIVGASGVGKSAFMARAAQQTREDLPHARVAVRFIGATPGSADGRALLDSLCHQVSTLYGADTSSLPADYRGLAQEFPKRIALATSEQPLVVFLDALDQFTEFDPARFLNWLPVTLPAHVHLVVSLPPGDRQVVLERRLPAGSLVELEPMASQEGEALLDLWLRDAGRMLQPPQRDEVLRQFQGNGLPLYLRFAFEEARRWPSYADPRRTTLSDDIAGIIRNNLFARLADEANHGAMLVARSLGYLAAAKNGLIEDELLDVLSRDAEVLADFYRRSPRSPAVDRLPVVVWSRLSFDLEPYLAERAADGASLLAFYHRQLREAVVVDYLAETARTERHRALAAYFGEQDLEFRRDGEAIANVRKLAELPYQQTWGELWDELFATLTDFRFLERKAATGEQARRDTEGRETKIYTGVFDLQADYELALMRFPGATEGKGGGGIGTGVPIITAVHFPDRDTPVFRCPKCLQFVPLFEEWLGTTMTCPREDCGGRLKLNPFVAGRSQGQPVSESPAPQPRPE